MRRTLATLLVLGSLLAAPPVLAEDDELPLSPLDELDTEEQEGQTLVGMMDEGHADLTEQVVEIGRRLDRFFGGEQYQRSNRTSELRLGLQTLLSEDGVEFNTNVRFRLALPNTERRLSLILESARDDLFGEERAERPPGAIRREGEERRGYFAGLRYAEKLAKDWGVDADAGIRVRLPLEPYVRLRGGRSWFLGSWETRLSQSVFWEQRDGPGATTEMLVQSALTGPRFLQSVSRATWLDDEQRFFYSQLFIFSHAFSERHIIQLRLGANAESEPDHRITRYYVNLPWRRNIYRSWLFLELRPELLFERESDFEVQPRLMLELEGYFGERHVTRPRPPAPL